MDQREETISRLLRKKNVQLQTLYYCDLYFKEKGREEYNKAATKVKGVSKLSKAEYDLIMNDFYKRAEEIIMENAKDEQRDEKQNS